MRRVLVMGCSGSGKSTFATALAARLAVPYVSLDGMFWKPGWVEPDKAEFAAEVAAVTEHDSWVIDGNYTSHAGAIRRDRADTVCLFDLPRLTCLAGVIRRSIASYGRVRPEMAPGCPEKVDFGFYRYVWTYRDVQHPKLLAYVGGLRDDQRLATFTTRADADAFLAAVPPAGRA
ncbi:DNA topology modulation protein [Phreatobacter aquaticus]|uniref:DNA topology modulation protein n=1 Tax=Phreatobacter aquaticus TaxID=2570229 RepID=A0A4D7QLQ6_9HYPH|nr:DNA topology modulation protein [Phreatobacter aquaticus]QCK87481.1 DNA topology modulation protein [Phreatobacter aquaticus]